MRFPANLWTRRRRLTKKSENGRWTNPGSLAYRPRSRDRMRRAWVAQLVEQRIENPRVGGSNPPPGTTSSFSNKVPQRRILPPMRRRCRFTAKRPGHSRASLRRICGFSAELLLRGPCFHRQAKRHIAYLTLWYAFLQRKLDCFPKGRTGDGVWNLGSESSSTGLGVSTQPDALGRRFSGPGPRAGPVNDFSFTGDCPPGCRSGSHESDQTAGTGGKCSRRPTSSSPWPAPPS